MTANVRDAGPFERVVGFELTDAEIDAAKAGAARRLSQDLKLKGFRPGKAPTPVVEAAVGKEKLRTEAIEDVIPQRLTEVLRDEELSPATQPELENLTDVEGGVAVEVKITLWPALEEAPAYRDRTVEVESIEVTDEDIDDQLVRMREQFGQVEEVERPAGDGDFVSIDVEAEMDGEEVEEASATELLYRVGTGGLVPGADDHLLGASAGDVVTFDAPMPTGPDPEDAHGPEATFTVTVNEVKELVLPELTDEWVDENTEFDTVGQLRDTLAERMADLKRSQVANQFRERALETLVEEVELELPDAILRSEMDELLHRFAHRLEQQDISLEDYFQVTGVSREQFAADLQAQARQSLMTRLVLEAVAADAGVEVSDQEVEAVLRSVATQTEDPQGFVAAVRGTPQELSLRSDILRDKALEAILEHATAVDADGNEVDIDLDESQVPMGRPVEGTAGEAAGEIVEGEVVEGEVIEGDLPAGAVVAGTPLTTPEDTTREDTTDVEGESTAPAGTTAEAGDEPDEENET